MKRFFNQLFLRPLRHLPANLSRIYLLTDD